MTTSSLAAPAAPPDPTLLELTSNPADRLWRYPLARQLLRVAPRWLTPMHVTVFHTLMAFGAAALVLDGRPWALATAFGLYELRAVLDCFDGVLARARKLASPLGRAIDQAADSVSFVAFITAVGVHLGHRHGALYGASMAVLATLATASGTACWDYFRRRFSSLIEKGHDEVEAEFVEVERAWRAHGGFARWYARVVATYQFMLLNPSALRRVRARAEVAQSPDDPSELRLVARLREAAARDDRELRAALWQIGLAGGDSTYFLLTLSTGLGAMHAGVLGATAFTVLCVLVTTLSCTRLLSRDAD